MMKRILMRRRVARGAMLMMVVTQVMVILSVSGCRALATDAATEVTEVPTTLAAGTPMPTQASESEPTPNSKPQQTETKKDSSEATRRVGVVTAPTPVNASSRATASSMTALGAPDPTHSPQPSSAARVTATPAVPLPLPHPDAYSHPDIPCNPRRLPLITNWVWANTVLWHPDGSAVFFSLGPVVYAAAADGSRLEVVADASLKTRTLPDSEVDLYGPMTSFDISPEGDRLVYATCAFPLETASKYVTTYEYEIAVVDLEDEEVQQLTRNGLFENYPSWSPDGSQIAFVAAKSRADDFNAFFDLQLDVMAADGLGRRRISLGKHAIFTQPPKWSPDGSRLAVVGFPARAVLNPVVYTLRPDGTDLQRLGPTGSGPAWSPDGLWLAFVSPERPSGNPRVIVTMKADGTEVNRVPLPHGWEPFYHGYHRILFFGENWVPTLAWSPTGEHLLYTCGLGVCVVAPDGAPVGQSPSVFEMGSVAAWSPDGTRIAVVPGAVWPPYGDGMFSDLVPYTMAPDGTDVRMLAQIDAARQPKVAGPREDGSS